MGNYSYIQKKDRADILNLCRNLNTSQDYESLLALILMVSNDALVYSKTEDDTYRVLNSLVMEAIQDYCDRQHKGYFVVRKVTDLLAITYLESWGTREEWTARWNIMVDGHWGTLSGKKSSSGRILLDKYFLDLKSRQHTTFLRPPFKTITFDYALDHVLYYNDYDHLPTRISEDMAISQLSKDINFLNQWFRYQNKSEDTYSLEDVLAYYNDKGLQHYKVISGNQHYGTWNKENE